MYELISSEEAAQVLRVSPANLSLLIAKGELRPTPKRTRQGRQFRKHEVIALAEVLHSEVSPREALRDARASLIETRALRKELDELRFLLGIDMPHLGTDRDTLVALILQAEDLLRAPPVRNRDQLFFWARMFYALREGHFAAITQHTGQAEPWRVFLALGHKLCSDQQPLLIRDDPEYRAVYQLLYAGLQQARRAAFFHIQDVYGARKAVQLFPETTGCPHEQIISLAFQTTQYAIKSKKIKT